MLGWCGVCRAAAAGDDTEEEETGEVGMGWKKRGAEGEGRRRETGGTNERKRVEADDVSCEKKVSVYIQYPTVPTFLIHVNLGGAFVTYFAAVTYFARWVATRNIVGEHRVGRGERAAVHPLHLLLLLLLLQAQLLQLRRLPR